MEKHPDPETLARFAKLGLERDALRTTAWHLYQCGMCRRAMARSAPEGLAVLGHLIRSAGLERPAREPRGNPSYAEIFAKVRSSVERTVSALPWERSQAPGILRKLLPLDGPERRRLLREKPEFRRRAVAELCVQRAMALYEDELERVEPLAQLGLEILELLDDPDPVAAALAADLAAEAWCAIGNARRIRSDLRAADRAFARCRDLLAKGTKDPLAWAQVATYEASLKRAQRQFAAGERLLGQAIAIFRRAGDREWQARALINRALSQSYRGATAEAIEDLELAQETADFSAHPRLELVIQQNLLLCLKNAGRLADALALLPRVRQLCARRDRHLDGLNLDWLEGQLLIELGRRSQARQLLEQARDGFVAAGIGYSAALVSLDLALVLLEQGLVAEVKTLAQESLPIFLSRDVPAESATALALFRQAAVAERATADMVRDLLRTLRPQMG
ncbi:MAG: hypothetical protein AAF604_08995 [Acidobacteriota bacterium]